MPISKVKKERWCDEEWRMKKGGELEEEEGGRDRRGLLCCILTGDLGHFAHEHICYGASPSFPKQCQPD